MKETNTFNPEAKIINAKGIVAPEVLTLPDTCMKVSGLRGTRFLQVHYQTDIRDCPDLCHVVMLGNKASTKRSLFQELPTGCVLHVENHSIAKTIINKVYRDDIYVIPDALDWKDFPAHLRDMSQQQYAPESLLLPEQRDIRKCLERRRANEAKNKMQGDLVNIVLAPVMSQLGITRSTTRLVPGTYTISICKLAGRAATANISICMATTTHNRSQVQIDIELPLQQVLEKAPAIPEIIRKTVKLHRQYRTLVTQSSKTLGDAPVSLRFLD